MTGEQLKEILERHGRWLRGEPQGVRADLWGADLRDADLRDADLTGADLTNADLTGADLPEGIPVVEDLDRKILAAVTDGVGSLVMREWHTCETTHCRAGWAIVLAGPEGMVLEERFGPAVAGALIYAASRPGRPVPDFYTTNYEAMASIREDAGVGWTARRS